MNDQHYECVNCGARAVVTLLELPCATQDHKVTHCALCGSEDIQKPEPPDRAKQQEALQKAAEKGYQSAKNEAFAEQYGKKGQVEK